MGANAQTTVPTFTAAQVLTADQQNQSARTGVPVFATTTTRDAGFGGTGEKTLAEGQLCYVEGVGLQTYNGTSWVTWGTRNGVIQVQSTAKLDTFTTTSQTFGDITGLSVTITPTSASNKVLVIAQIAVSTGFATAYGFFKLTGGNSGTYIGDAAGNRISAVFGGYSTADQSAVVQGLSIVYLDSPATTSATTYKVQTRGGLSVPSVAVNRSHPDNNDANAVRGASSITAIEVTP